MCSDKKMLDIIKKFLPPTSKIISFETPDKRPAVEFKDIDGDNKSEIVGAYYWQGDIYIIILKYYYDMWHVLDRVKGKGYNITYFDVAPVTSKYKNNLIVGWQVGAIWSDLSIYELIDTKLMDLIVGNKYFSRMEVQDFESNKEKNGMYELALWIHDTGKAYRVEIYRWLENNLKLALDVYPYYFEKVVDYYKALLKEQDSTTYWYYLADAQIKTGNTEDACKSINKALSFEYPYPSTEKLMELKNKICRDKQFFDKYGMDFLPKNPSIEMEEFRETKPTNQSIIDVKVGKVVGNYTNDKVILQGHYLNKDSSYVEDVEIVINPQNDETPIITKIPYTGYNLELFLGDFNGDEKEEIMVRGEYGGSGGYAIAAIYKYKDGQLLQIFNPDMFSKKYKFIAKYLENYKVLVESVDFKKKYTFDISENPAVYLNTIYDENGKIKGVQQPIVSDVNSAYPIKTIYEKKYLLFIRQKVIGFSNADKIGYIESFVNLLNSDINVIEMGAYEFGEKIKNGND